MTIPTIAPVLIPLSLLPVWYKGKGLSSKYTTYALVHKYILKHYSNYKFCNHRHLEIQY